MSNDTIQSWIPARYEHAARSHSISDLLGGCKAAPLASDVLPHAGAVQGGISVLPSLYPYVYRDNVTNTFFGTEVADPYRWLENTDSNETLACEDLPQ